MRRSGILMILLGVVFAILAGVSLFVMFPRQAQPVREPTTSLVVAFQNIPDQTTIGPDQVGRADWPQHIPTPNGAFANEDEVIGKIAQQSIYQGQPVIGQMLVDKGELQETHSNAALILKPGTVAVAIPVDTNSNVAEAVQAGDRVDVLASFFVKPITDTVTVTKSDDDEAIKVTQRLAQDVLVLQVGTWPHIVAPTPGPASGTQAATVNTAAATARQTNQGPIVVTLQVESQDALVLKYMEVNSASFALALRPANDHALVNPTPVTIEYLMERYGFRVRDMAR